MSNKELGSMEVILEIIHQKLTQKNAAKLLNLSTRHVKRLCKQYLLYGPKGLISKKKGTPSNRKTPKALVDKVVEIIKELYPDFGPTLAHEKLKEQHGVTLSSE
jgi:hypothetical protein